LVESVRDIFPSRFFSRWAVREGTQWTPQRLVWAALLMFWDAEQRLGDSFAMARQTLRQLFPKWSLGKTYTGWSKAMAAWWPKMQPAVARRLRRQMEAQAGRWRTREGWCALAADGSRFECPRTAVNAEVLGCAGKERTAPQLFLTTLWHMGLGVPWDYRIGPGTSSERRHLEAMAADLPANALIVADAGFVGFDLCRRIEAAGQRFLLRVGANVHLLRKLGYAFHENGATVYLWPSGQQHEPPLVMRRIVVRDGQRRMHLLTNVLEATALTDSSAAALYRMRWGVEVFYRSCKQTLEKRKLQSRTPKAAEIELHGAVLGTWVLGMMTVASLVTRQIDPLRWSVAQARRCIRRAMQRAGQPGRRRRLRNELAEAVRDTYVRLRPKKARDWPHKKRESPPGDPKIRLATAQEIQAAQRVKTKRNAA
jgi:hypothetical protein